MQQRKLKTKITYPIQGIVLYWVGLEIILGWYLKILKDIYEIKRFKQGFKIKFIACWVGKLLI
jgi:hypothetical protein